NALGQLGRHREATESWQRAIELNDSTGANLAVFLAASQAEEALRAAKPPAELVYEAARICAGATRAGAAENEASLKERYARRALELLKQAKAAGWFQDPKKVKLMREDDVFKSLPAEQIKAFLDSL